MNRVLRSLLVLVTLVGAYAWFEASAKSNQSAAPPASIPTFSTANIGREGFFFVGGHYLEQQGKHVWDGSMYVEVMVPKNVRHPYPIVFMPVGGLTGIEYLQTPDGRPGWARWYVDQGYVVYTVDPPGRGRSPWVEDFDPRQNKERTAETVEREWTDSGELGPWPQAKKFTQWPGSGRMGDPVFDNFSNYEVSYVRENFEDYSQPTGVALLDKIGPAILVAHAQNTGTAWLMADSRPKLVKGIIALQASGPPIGLVDSGSGKLDYSGGKGRVWGVTFNPIHYDPPIKNPSELQLVKQDRPEGPNLAPCWRQKEPARKLINLIGIPVLVATSEAGYHRVYDHCTAEWLNQAGVKTEFVGLESVGLRGNDDLEPIEKNSLDIAKYLEAWIEKNVH